ncbi:hypothetical protein ATI61_1245 [Archangium gephyra]|uniref:Lipoprotein n=1 Tax=Archangium gephyra TaxID=48 RepID=A0AAC8TAW6_9BACT|nr:DUF6748 domain-containing protein [Archangium gephyra]AKI99281.1 putative lipoprotein [Archangium gephyra]REG15420.1 hypothetical protein ATI61_1245 [Archangium gephyra]
MTFRQPLLTAALALGLLAGCSKGTTPAESPRAAESGGTPSAPMDKPATDKPATAPEPTSGGTAAAPSAERGPAVFFLRNSGVRCMTTPCPYFIATRPDRPGDEPIQVHEVDTAALGVSDEKRASILEVANGNPGLKVEGTLDTVPNAGPAGAATVLRVRRVVEGQ